MKRERLPQGISTLLRPVFAALLAVSQFSSQRAGILTQNAVVVGAGILITAAGFWLWLAAARHLRPAQAMQTVATTGPYRAIRHPVYASMYLICVGVGLIFFAWLWFAILLAFAPLWWLEAKTEEDTMRATYGEAYDDYRDRTAMWIPGVW
jgi:protein-S-isoprenylcysteine O-methyltransferase Ste14